MVILQPSTSTIPLNAPVIAVSRYFVEPAQKAKFDAAFRNGAPYLGAQTAPFAYNGGWRIDKEGDGEEFVLFSGWNKVQDHYSFAETEGFKEFGKIKDALQGAEIKHVQLEKWE
jgi:heme-degrading monooxygenase HmoA